MTTPFDPYGQPQPPQAQPPPPVPPQQYPAPPQEYPPAYAYPAYPAPQPSRGTDGLAVAALVLAILAIVPVAVVLAIIALSRMKKSGQGGKGLAIAALIISAVWFVVGILIAVLAVAFGDEVVDAIETEIRYSDYIEDLSVGDCIDFEPDLFDSGTAIEPEEPFLQIVECSGEHQEEVIALPVVPGDDYPGDAELEGIVEEECLSAFEAYVGATYEDSKYDITYFSPTAETWALGDRQVLCTVFDPAGPVDDTIRGSAQ